MLLWRSREICGLRRRNPLQKSRLAKQTRLAGWRDNTKRSSCSRAPSIHPSIHLGHFDERLSRETSDQRKKNKSQVADMLKIVFRTSPLLWTLLVLQFAFSVAWVVAPVLISSSSRRRMHRTTNLPADYGDSSSAAEDEEELTDEELAATMGEWDDRV